MRSISFNECSWLGYQQVGVKYGGFATVNWSHVLERFKTCELHFKDCWNREEQKLREHRRCFKELCNRLLEAESPVFCKAKEELENVTEGDSDRNIYTGVKWWHKTRNYIL